MLVQFYVIFTSLFDSLWLNSNFCWIFYFSFRFNLKFETSFHCFYSKIIIIIIITFVNLKYHHLQQQTTNYITSIFIETKNLHFIKIYKFFMSRRIILPSLDHKNVLLPSLIQSNVIQTNDQPPFNILRVGDHVSINFTYNDSIQYTFVIKINDNDDI